MSSQFSFFGLATTILRVRRGAVAALLFGCGSVVFAEIKAAEAVGIDFKKDIQPLFSENCYKCHDSGKQKGGYRLDVKDIALKGGDSGEKAIVAGDPEHSRLLKLVRGDKADEVMPPKGDKLSPKQVELLTAWIKQGAAWPDELSQKPVTKHWAFLKPQKPALPAVSNPKWPRNGLDYFVMAKQDEVGLKPSMEADRYALVRRLSLDLRGLPPTPEEVETFVRDNRPQAYEELVERFLNSPSYGERWARMWLDLARYADSKGYGSDSLRPYMWRYRDWVISAFNRNIPYDQFTREQLAGDLLPNPTMDQLLATSFHRNTMSNDEGGTDDEEFRVAAIKDRIDSTAQIWMGLTLGCAKCHSHKFDPITQREYYSFYALFNQTQDNDSPDDQPRLATPTETQEQQIARVNKELDRLKREIAEPKADLAKAQTEWERRVAATDSEWTALRPAKYELVGGVETKINDDQSVQTTTKSPDTYRHKIDVETNLRGITAFRLDVLDHGEVKEGKVAKTKFSLNDFAVTLSAADPKPVKGRFVRVEIPGSQKILSLAEVEVFKGANNLARAGKASQSSTEYGSEAGLAIDGNTNGDHNAKSVTHTATSDNPWWEVDLGESKEVERIGIWNRTDADLQGRLKDFNVSVLDADRKVVWTQKFPEPPRNSLFAELGGATRVQIAEATASIAEGESTAAKAVDGDASAKSSWSFTAGSNGANYAVFKTASPVGAGENLKLTFTLLQPHGMEPISTRFRISASTAAEPLQAVPTAVQSLLAAKASDRTEAQKKEIAAHFWSLTPEYRSLQAQMKTVQQNLANLDKEVVRTPIMRELPADKARTTRLLVKGNYLMPGDTVEPGFPVAFHPLPKNAPNNRLGVAAWLTDKENPLTARVAVNRFWANLFGKGLVETEEDFGTQGLPPTHPQLLDWLATEFVDLRWNIKDLLKLIVTSATYRQSAGASSELLEKDPRNVWLARAPRFRLEAEIVRDQALALSGLLSPKMFGPSVYPPQPPNLWQAAFNGERTWSTSMGEDKYRRGLYTFWRRTVPYPSMAAFDAPSREVCNIKRVATSTPLQAFVTLNDPVYVEAAQALARRLVKEGGATPAERIKYGLRLCLSRPAHARQVEALTALYQTELERFLGDAEAAKKMAESQLGAAPAGSAVGELAAWTVVANILLNMDGVLTKS